MTELLLQVGQATGITTTEIVAILGALGVGGIITKLIERYTTRERTEAETDEIMARTNKSIAEIVEANTARLRGDFEEALKKIDKLEATIDELRGELDSNRQIMRIRALEADVRFYRNRVNILERQNLELTEQKQELKNEISK